MNTCDNQVDATSDCIINDVLDWLFDRFSHDLIEAVSPEESLGVSQ